MVLLPSVVLGVEQSCEVEERVLLVVHQVLEWDRSNLTLFTFFEGQDDCSFTLIYRRRLKYFDIRTAIEDTCRCDERSEGQADTRL